MKHPGGRCERQTQVQDSEALEAECSAAELRLQGKVLPSGANGLRRGLAAGL